MKQLTVRNCPSEDIIVKLLMSTNAGDIELGLNYLGTKDFEYTRDFLSRNNFRIKLDRLAGAKFFVKCKDYIIVSGWYYIDAHKTIYTTLSRIGTFKTIEICNT